ncbi:MAG: M48 family metalloprotease [Gemmatimonadetes bacterium]|nr:M48 family metalloprotease [Gemmatimonadota bacterium]
MISRRELVRYRITTVLALPVLAAACFQSGPLPPSPAPGAPAGPPGALADAAANAEPPPSPSGADAPTRPTIESERALQMEGAVRTRLDRLQRLHDLTMPLLRGGLEMCKGHLRNELGFLYATLDQYPADAERRVYETVLGIRSWPTVLLVVSGSAAERAGIAPGDFIASVGGVTVPGGRPGRETIAAVTRRWPAGSALPVQVERNGMAVDIRYPAETVCDYDIAVTEDDEINAWASGDAIHVSRGLMRFPMSDTHLQAVLAHEIAHNSEGHLAEITSNLVLTGLRGSVRDAAAEAARPLSRVEFSRTQEHEADYVGMYYLARAGIDTREVGQVWRLLAAENPEGVRDRGESTHPSLPERFLRLEATHREITLKLEAGLPLLPNRTRDGALIVPRVG